MAYPYEEEEELQALLPDPNPPEVQETQPVYDAPTIRGEKSPYGFSSVDLTDHKNVKQMWAEYRDFKVSWPHSSEEYRNDPERIAKEEAWYQKYYGMSKEEHDRRRQEHKLNANPGTEIVPWAGEVQATGTGGFYPGAEDPIRQARKNILTLGAVGQGAADFALDAIGSIPGLGGVDDWYDKKTYSSDPVYRAARDMANLVVPSLLLSGSQTKWLMNNKVLSPAQKKLVGSGLFTMNELAIIGLSDLGEGDNSLRALSDFFPGVFGPEGFAPIPNWAKTLDSDSPQIRQYKNYFDTGFITAATQILGAFVAIRGGKKKMDWFTPVDESATKYKQLQLAKNADPDKLIRMQEINEVLTTKKLSKQNEQILADELMALQAELGTIDNIDTTFRQEEISSKIESQKAAVRKLQEAEQLNLDLGYDPDVSPGITSKPGTGRSIPKSKLSCSASCNLI